MIDICNVSQGILDSQYAGVKKEYLHTVTRVLKNYVGDYDKLDKNGKSLYKQLFEDFIQTGYATQFDTEALLDNAESWRTILYEKLPGTYLHAKTTMRGKYTSTGLNKTVEILRKRRDAREAFFRTGKTKFMEMAFDDPAMTAFYDRTGQVFKVVNMSKNYGPQVEQMVNHVYYPYKRVYDALETLVAAKTLLHADVRVDVQDIGFQPTVILQKGLRKAKLYSHENGVCKVKYEDNGIFDTIPDSELGMSPKDYSQWLTSQIVSGLSNRIGEDQMRYVNVKKVSDIQDNKEIAEQVVKLAKSNRHKHVVSDGKYNYYYVFVKKKYEWNERENTYRGGESYAFLVGKTEVDEKGNDVKGTATNLLANPDDKSFEDFQKMMQDGWYTSEKQTAYSIQYFDKYKNEPSEYIIKYWKNYKKVDIGLDDKIMRGQNSIMHLVAAWETQVRDRVADDFEVRMFGKKDKNGKVIYRGIEERINDVKDDVVKYYMETEGLGKKDAFKKMLDLLQIGHIDQRFSIDKGGSIHIGNAGFTRISKHAGYMPRMYDVEDYWEMLDAAAKTMSDRIETAKSQGVSGDAVSDAEETLAEIQNLREYEVREQEGENSQDESNQLILTKSLVHAKHRGSMLDATRRRTDPAVIPDYLRKVYSTIAHNELVLNLFEGIANAKKWNIPDVLVRHMINSVKQTLGDPNTEGVRGGTGGSYTQMASWINAIHNKIYGQNRRQHTAEDARKIIMFIRGMMTAAKLGVSAALNNSTQSVNDYIVLGSRLFSHAWSLEATDEWQDAAKETGVDNIFSAWEMAALAGEQTTLRDMPFIPGTLVPTPRGDIGKIETLFRLSRDRFIKGMAEDEKQRVGLQRLDKFLERLADNTSQRNKGNVAYLKKLKEGLNKLGGKNENENMRAAFYDYWTSDDIDILMARWKVLTGKQSKLLARKMASWKLSWLPGNLAKARHGVGGWLTFPGVEGRMRRVSAIGTVLLGLQTGVIPGDLTDSPRDIMNRPEAQNLARMSVQMTMFGLSTPHLGRAFDGWLSGVMQWKHFPLKQFNFTTNVLQSFYRSSPTKWSMVTRVKDVFWNKIKKDGSKSKPDVEAEVMLRMSASRLLASAIMSLIGVVPILSLLPSVLRKNSSGFNTFGISRNFEDPVIALAMRTIVWTAMSAWGGDDDDEKRYRKKWLNVVQMLTLPALIGIAVTEAKKVVKSLDKIINS